MRRLSERAATACAYAKKPKCRCRCGGALHGKRYHGRTTEEIIGQLAAFADEGQLSERGLEAVQRLRETVKVQEALLSCRS
jgi:hypothetical protein